ncbi:MAG: hypothetical protein L0Z62_09370 [Gemmataceae bacterium]|nr:hypothetical protein [Gemmataceae bacterium]
MAAPDNKNSVEHWQRVATRWRLVALAAVVVMGMTVILAGVLLTAENTEKVRALEQLREEAAVKRDALRLLGLWKASAAGRRNLTFAERALLRGDLKRIDEAVGPDRDPHTAVMLLNEGRVEEIVLKLIEVERTLKNAERRK